MLVEFGEFAFGGSEAFPASGVFLFSERFAVNFGLTNEAFDGVEFLRNGVNLHFEAAGGLVHEIDCFVGEESVGDVAVAESSSGNDRAVGDPDAVVDFVALFEATEDADGFFDAWFADVHLLEPAFESFVLFDVESVFVEGGGTDAAKFAASEHGFEHVGGVEAAFGFPGPDEGVHFVDEEDDAALAALDVFEDGFQPLFKFASVFGSGDHGAEIEGDDRFVSQTFGDIAGDDALSQAFDDGGFADAGFTDEDGVVFGAAAEDLDHAADFFVAPDDGVEFALTGTVGEVIAEFFEGLISGLGVLVGDFAAATDFFDGGDEIV